MTSRRVPQPRSSNHHEYLQGTRCNRNGKQPRLVPRDETQDRSQLSSKDRRHDPNSDQPEEDPSHGEPAERHGLHPARAGQETDDARREGERHRRSGPREPPLEGPHEVTGPAHSALDPGKHQLTAPPPQEVAQQIDPHEAHEWHGEERQQRQSRRGQQQVAKPGVQLDQQQWVSRHEQWRKPVRRRTRHDRDTDRQQKRQGSPTRAWAAGEPALAHPTIVTDG